MFRAVDKAGNVSNVVSVTLDKTRPVVKAMSGEAEVQNGAVIRASIISAYATDTVSGIAKIGIQKSTTHLMPHIQVAQS